MKQRAVLGLLALTMGCYTLQPVANQPLPLGMQVSLGINDAGRVALGGSMGPEIGAIEGRLIQMDSAAYVVAVAQVQLLRGGEQVWSGERIRVQTAFVSSVSERRLSRGRTAVLGAAAVGAVAIMFSQGLQGLIAGDQGKPTPTDTGRTIRIPRFSR